MKDLKVRLEEVNESISRLKMEKLLIERKLLNMSTSLKEKLEIWEYSNNKKHIGDLFALSRYPNLYEYVRKRDLYRYKTYDFMEFFEDEIGSVLEDLPIDEKYLPLLKEIVENNLGSFEYDW